MKNNRFILGAVIILILLIIVIPFIYITKDNTTSDEEKFKKEYESLNGKKNKTSDKTIMSIDIPKKNKIKYVNSSEVIDILKNKSGVIYFGFPDCPWCRNAVPVLIKAASCGCQDEIYYFNALSIRDTKHLDDDGKIVTDKKGTKEYYEIVELLKEKLPDYEGLNDTSIKRLYFPTVVFVKDGEVIDLHVSTVESQTDPYKQLTKKQASELESIYKKGIESIKENKNICTSSDTSC